MTAPGYWMHEQSGVLRPVVERYLRNEPLSADDIATLRAYLQQWMRGGFKGPEVYELRQSVDAITDRAALDVWLARALDAGIDPL